MTSIVKVDNIQNSSGTAALSIDSGGRILFPQLPCACVSISTSNTQDGSNPYTTTGADMLFDVISVNRASAYNSSNGRFTAPIAGIYEFSYSLLKYNDSSSNTTYIDVYKNGSAYEESGGRGYSSVDAEYVLISQKLLISLAVNDYLTLRLAAGGLNLNSNGYHHSIVFKLVG